MTRGCCSKTEYLMKKKHKVFFARCSKIASVEWKKESRFRVEVEF